MNPRISLSFWPGPARVGNFLLLCLLVTPDLAVLHLDKVLVLFCRNTVVNMHGFVENL